MVKKKIFKGPQKLMVFPFDEEIQVLRQNRRGDRRR